MNAIDLYELHMLIEKEMKIVSGAIQAVIYAKNEAEVNNEQQTEWVQDMLNKMNEKIDTLTYLLKSIH